MIFTTILLTVAHYVILCCRYLTLQTPWASKLPLLLPGSKINVDGYKKLQKAKELAE